MKEYIKAILSTISLVVTQLILIPTLQWYKREFCEPQTELIGLYILLFFIALGMFIICFLLWLAAINNKSLEDYIKS